jgi:hypothetical protein
MSTELTNSQAEVVQQLLIDLTLCTDPTNGESWPVYESNEPDSPDEAVTVYDTEGVTEGRVQRTGETYEHRGVMLQTRGTTKLRAWAKADSLRRHLDESVHNAQVTIDTKTYTVYSVTRRSGPIYVGREPNTNRYLFTLNVVVALRQTN